MPHIRRAHSAKQREGRTTAETAMLISVKVKPFYAPFDAKASDGAIGPSGFRKNEGTVGTTEAK